VPLDGQIGNLNKNLIKNKKLINICDREDLLYANQSRFNYIRQSDKPYFK
jgi:hypothetical protein